MPLPSKKPTERKAPVAKAGSKFPLTLEQLFVSPELFDVPTATAVQRAKCRIVEGLPVGDLAHDPNVIEMCGGTVPELGERPDSVLDISAIRIGKSLFAAAFLFWLAQTVDLSRTRDSDIVRLFVVALKIDGTAAVVKHLVQPLTSKPAFRPYLADEPKDISVGSVQRGGLRLFRPHDGRTVEIVCIPLDRGGGSALSVYCAGLVVDEYPRMIGAQDGVRNVEHFRDGVQGRMLPGAVQLYTGSPWQPYGPAYDNTVKFFGKPNIDLVVLRTSAKSFIGLGEWTQKKVERLQRINQLAYRTDYLAEFADGEEAVFPAQAIDDAVSRSTVRDADFGRPAVFADPSALRHDYWAAMVGGWVYPRAHPEDLYEHELLGDTISPPKDARPSHVVQGARGWIRIFDDQWGNPIRRHDTASARPWFEVYDIVSWNKSSGARGTDLVKAVGDLARKYGAREFHWDGYEQLMLGDLIRQQGLTPHVHTWSGAGRKTDAVDHLRTLFIERRVKLPEPPSRPFDSEDVSPHELLKQELVRFRAKPTPGGNFQYIVAGGAGHGDHASCLTLAMRADLDGYVDRSPTQPSVGKVVIHDHVEEDYDDYS